MAQNTQYTDLNLSGNSIVAGRFENLAAAPTSPALGQQYYNTTNNKFYGWNGTGWIDLSQIVAAATAVKGEITNANTNPAFPSTPAPGDTYFITTTGGTVGGLTVEVGDMLIYGINGWFVLQSNLQAATAAVAGYIQLATQAEVNAGSNNSKAVTPNTLGQFLIGLLYTRKVTTLIASLAANTATTVTHGLALANADDLIVDVRMGGQNIGVAVATVSVNTISITANQALTNVKVVCVG